MVNYTYMESDLLNKKILDSKKYIQNNKNVKLTNSRREMGEVKRQSGKRTTLYMREFERRIEQVFSSVQFSRVRERMLNPR